MLVGRCRKCKNQFRKREKSYKFCSLLCSNRYNLNNKNKVNLPKYSKKLAEFIGICLGDGYSSIYQTEITLNSNADKEYIPYVASLAKYLFPGATISLKKNISENAIRILINSKTVSDFLKKMGNVPNKKYIPNWILKNSSYKKGCMRGLFDTEGSISFKVYAGQIRVGLYKQLNFRNTNMVLMKFIRDELISFGFKPTRTLKKSLYLSNHESIAEFGKKIGFSNPKLQERSQIITIEDYRKWND
jgi:hypothetical protein